jgi:hypothetical protein
METKVEMRVKKITKVVEQDKEGNEVEKFSVVFRDTEGNMILKFANEPDAFSVGTWYQISIKPVNKTMDEYAK